jgi:hypothetical protein
MVIFLEKNLRPVSVIRNFTIRSPKGVKTVFDAIDDAFFGIESLLNNLNIIFFDTRWNLEEGITASLRAYTEAGKKVRIYLANISMMNATLVRFLASETRPIPIHPNATVEINRQIDATKNAFNAYYKYVKGALFPKFDTEKSSVKSLSKLSMKTLTGSMK